MTTTALIESFKVEPISQYALQIFWSYRKDINIKSVFREAQVYLLTVDGDNSVWTAPTITDSQVTNYNLNQLQPNTRYRVCLSVTKSGGQVGADTERKCNDVSTTLWHAPAWIGTVIGACIALCFIVVLVIISRYLRRSRKNSNSQRGRFAGSGGNKQSSTRNRADSESHFDNDDEFSFSTTPTDSLGMSQCSTPFNLSANSATAGTPLLHNSTDSANFFRQNSAPPRTENSSSPPILLNQPSNSRDKIDNSPEETTSICPMTPERLSLQEDSKLSSPCSATLLSSNSQNHITTTNHPATLPISTITECHPKNTPVNKELSPTLELTVSVSKNSLSSSQKTNTSVDNYPMSLANHSTELFQDTHLESPPVKTNDKQSNRTVVDLHNQSDIDSNHIDSVSTTVINKPVLSQHCDQLDDNNLHSIGIYTQLIETL